MEKKILELEHERTLSIEIEDRKLLLSVSASGLQLDVRLNPAQANKLMDAIAQFLAETP